MFEEIEPANIRALKFERQFEPDGEDGMREKVWVTWAKKGAGIPTHTTDKVERLRRDPSIWAALEPAYLAWEAGTNFETDGTPFDVWPGLLAHEVEELRKHKIHSVEDFAGMTDSDFKRCAFPKIREKRDRAREYLKNRDAMDEMDALRQKIAELTAAKDAGKAEGDAPKRGPGRPRRDEAEAA